MEFAIALRKLLAHRRILAAGVIVALVAGTLAIYKPHGLGLQPRSGVSHSTASTQVLIDSSRSALADIGQSVTPLQALASTLANFAPTSAVLDLIGQHAGLQGSQLYAEGPISPNLPRAVLEPTNLQRNIQIAGEPVPFRLQFNADPNVPEIGIFAQAPTTAEAVRLANGAAAGLSDYIKQLAANGKIPSARQVVLRQLGQAAGSVDSPSAGKALALIAFVAVLVAWCLMMLLVQRFRRIWRESSAEADARAESFSWGAAGLEPSPPSAPGSPAPGRAQGGLDDLDLDEDRLAATAGRFRRSSGSD